MERVTTLEERMICHLALHPRRNIQQIQRGLNMKDRNYPSVRNAMRRLKKKGYAEATEGKSEKNLPIKFYKLSTKGIGYTLAYANEQATLTVLATYENVEPQLKNFLQITQHLSPSILLKLLRIVGKGVLQYGESYLQNQTIAIFAIEGLHMLSAKEYKELKKEMETCYDYEIKIIKRRNYSKYFALFSDILKKHSQF